MKWNRLGARRMLAPHEGGRHRDYGKFNWGSGRSRSCAGEGVCSVTWEVSVRKTGRRTLSARAVQFLAEIRGIHVAAPGMKSGLEKCVMLL